MARRATTSGLAFTVFTYAFAYYLSRRAVTAAGNVDPQLAAAVDKSLDPYLPYLVMLGSVVLGLVQDAAGGELSLALTHVGSAVIYGSSLLALQDGADAAIPLRQLLTAAKLGTVLQHTMQVAGAVACVSAFSSAGGGGLRSAVTRMSVLAGAYSIGMTAARALPNALGRMATAGDEHLQCLGTALFACVAAPFMLYALGATEPRRVAGAHSGKAKAAGKKAAVTANASTTASASAEARSLMAKRVGVVLSLPIWLCVFFMRYSRVALIANAKLFDYSSLLAPLAPFAAQWQLPPPSEYAIPLLVHLVVVPVAARLFCRGVAYPAFVLLFGFALTCSTLFVNLDAQQQLPCAPYIGIAYTAVSAMIYTLPPAFTAASLPAEVGGFALGVSAALSSTAYKFGTPFLRGAGEWLLRLDGGFCFEVADCESLVAAEMMLITGMFILVASRV